MYGENKKKKSHIKCNWSAENVVFIASSNTKYNQMGSYTFTFTRLFPLNIVSLSGNLEWQNLIDYYILPTWQNILWQKETDVACQDSYLCFSQSLAVLDFFSNKWQNHSPDTFHLCSVASLGFAGVFAFQELLCLSFDFFLVPHFLQVYSGFLFSLFSVHISLPWDFP